MIYYEFKDALRCVDRLVKQYAKETGIDLDSCAVVKEYDIKNVESTISIKTGNEIKPIVLVKKEREGLFYEHSLYPVYYCTQWEVIKLWGDNNENQ